MKFYYFYYVRFLGNKKLNDYINILIEKMIVFLLKM